MVENSIHFETGFISNLMERHPKASIRAHGPGLPSIQMLSDQWCSQQSTELWTEGQDVCSHTLHFPLGRNGLISPQPDGLKPQCQCQHLNYLVWYQESFQTEHWEIKYHKEIRAPEKFLQGKPLCHNCCLEKKKSLYHGESLQILDNDCNKIPVY